MTHLPLPIPGDIAAADPDFIRVLNQRLAVIAKGLNANDAAATAANATEIGYGVHGLRGASTAQIYYETDRKALYVLTGPGQWTLAAMAAPMSGTLAQMLASGMIAQDAGLKWRTTDYLHTHIWTGSAWAFAAEDDGSHYFRIDGTAPNVGKWQKCDGSTINWCDGAGNLTSSTLPNLAAGDIWPVFGNVYTGTPAAEVQGTLVNSTDSAGSHSHSVTVAGGTTGTPSAVVAVQSGTGINVPSGTHTHAQGASTSGATDTQGAHTHTLTAARTTAQRPPSIVLVLYFRQ